MKIAESIYSPVLYLSCSFLILRSCPEHISQIPRKLQMFGKCSELNWTELSWTELRLQWLKQISNQKVTHAFFVWLSHIYRGGSLTLCATILLYTFHNASVRNQTPIGRLQVLDGDKFFVSNLSRASNVAEYYFNLCLLSSSAWNSVCSSRTTLLFSALIVSCTDYVSMDPLISGFWLGLAGGMLAGSVLTWLSPLLGQSLAVAVSSTKGHNSWGDPLLQPQFHSRNCSPLLPLWD